MKEVHNLIHALDPGNPKRIHSREDKGELKKHTEMSADVLERSKQLVERSVHERMARELAIGVKGIVTERVHKATEKKPKRPELNVSDLIDY